MKMTTVEDLFIHELSDMYSAEKQLTKALPKMAKAANDDTLARAFKNHLKETEVHVKRIEKIADNCGYKLKRRKCEAMEGLIREGNSIIEELEEGTLRDMALISAAQKVEHYEIAGYLNLMKLAKDIDDRRSFSILDQTLAEEEGADEKLSRVADEELEVIDAEENEDDDEDSEEDAEEDDDADSEEDSDESTDDEDDELSRAA